jgi:23S rRNA pseudouridine955/2504/2580 synthase
MAGDSKYGSKEKEDLVRGLMDVGKESIPLHLHARKLNFVHPFKNENVEIAAPIPKYFRDTLNSFGWTLDEIGDDSTME